MLGIIAAVWSAPQAFGDAAPQSHIISSLDFPSDTSRSCDALSTRGPVVIDDCWNPGHERWIMRKSFKDAVDWVTAQMAEIGLQPYSTYNDGPSTSWGKGTQYRVTVEMDQDKPDSTPVYVADMSSVAGAPH